ncbi:uncharacterized protein [Oryza sativa Japonica Group]|uniref:uncharacterized protein n=1 Tax=Oryza sativa subsp. japonica TaxID=39947 RepID=UPI00339C0154
MAHDPPRFTTTELVSGSPPERGASASPSPIDAAAAAAEAPLPMPPLLWRTPDADGDAMAMDADDVNVDLGILGDSQGPRTAATTGWSSARRTSSSSGCHRHTSPHGCISSSSGGHRSRRPFSPPATALLPAATAGSRLPALLRGDLLPPGSSVPSTAVADPLLSPRLSPPTCCSHRWAPVSPPPSNSPLSPEEERRGERDEEREMGREEEEEEG